MIQAEYPPKMLQEIMGHASITTTLDLYGHLYPGDIGRYADRLDTAIGAAIGAASTGQNQAKRDRRRRSGRDVRSLTWELMGALGGTRTPSLLIRSLAPAVHRVPPRPAGAFLCRSHPRTHPVSAVQSRTVLPVRATSVQFDLTPL
jgi:hypothetical protein